MGSAPPLTRADIVIQIAILRDGELVQVGAPQQILEHPADDYVRRFVEKRVPA